MKFFIALVACLAVSVKSQAQLEKFIHQTFEIGDATQITLDLVGEYELVLWSGTSVMTETRIQLYNASNAILDHFVEKKQRYLIEADTSKEQARLYHHDKKRENIRTRHGNDCTEVVHLKVFIPDSFKTQNEKLMVRAK